MDQGPRDGRAAEDRRTLLRLAPRVVLDVAGSTLRVSAAGRRRDVPAAFLDVLALYREPHTLEDGWNLLSRSARGALGLAEAFAGLTRLRDLGVLVPDGGPPSDALDAPGAIFGPVVQIRMLEDRIRTSRFIEAIRRTVRPGDVVLDLGTGSGVFAVAAALAGARRVYAVESQPIAALADRFFRQTGLHDRIVLLRGVSTGIDLPEPADVLVSEIIGDDPLDEGIVAALADAGARMLKPDARRIPSALQICATPVEVPEEVRGRVILTPDLLRRWERRYRLPFRALAAPAARQGREVALTRLQINPWIARHWPVLGPPVVLLSIDLAAPLPLPSETEAPLVFDREGPLGGFLIHFEADLAPGLRLSTDARTVERSNHWRSILWILPEAARAGDRRPATLRAEHWRSAASAVFPR